MVHSWIQVEAQHSGVVVEDLGRLALAEHMVLEMEHLLGSWGLSASADEAVLVIAEEGIASIRMELEDLDILDSRIIVEIVDMSMLIAVSHNSLEQVHYLCRNFQHPLVVHCC